MKNAIEFILNYPKLYQWFKKIPLLSGILTIFGMFIFGIIDYDYGISALSEDLEFFVIFFWIFIGAVLAVISTIITALFMSPIVVIADSVSKEQDSSEE